MSTFTDWNGPYGSGPTKDMWKELIDQYKSLLDSNNYVEKIDGKGLSTNDFTTALKNKLDSINEGTASKGIGNVASGNTDLVTGDAVYQFCKNFINAVSGKGLSTNDFTDAYKDILDSVKNAAKYDVAETLTDDDAKLVTVSIINAALGKYVRIESGKGLSTNDFTDAYVNLLKIMTVYSIRFTDKKVPAYIGGADSAGNYYLLGALLDKAGTVYVKFINSNSFSAVVNFAVTPDYTGALSITCDNTYWKALKFKIVSSTNATGTKHAYLAVQVPDWVVTEVKFNCAGINFVPVDSEDEDWIALKPQGNCHDVVDCYAKQGFTASKLNVPVGHVGEVVAWSKFDADGNPIDYPSCFLPCDGSAVSADYPELLALGITNTPIVDYHLIVASSTADNNKTHTDALSIVEAIKAAKVYDNADDLPVDAVTGTAAILKFGKKAYVVIKNDSGWSQLIEPFDKDSIVINAAISKLWPDKTIVDIELTLDTLSVYNTPPCYGVVYSNGSYLLAKRGTDGTWVISED